MNRGTIDVGSRPGGLDLQATLESGQSYLWWREDGAYFEAGTTGDDGWYLTTARVDGTPAVVRTRKREDRLEWESTVDAGPLLRRRLSLGDHLPTIRETAPNDGFVQRAYDTYWGMRVVSDPPFPSVVSFICSAQMRVGRSHGMQQLLAAEYGGQVAFDARTYQAFPTPEALAARTEAELRELSLGYRAPYVQRTAEMVADGEADPADAVGRTYEAAREYLTQFVGVGQKGADCVLLFSLGSLEAVPLDTWIRTAIEEYYPDCEQGGYNATSRAIRERFGGAHAGYVQTYVFHYLRNGGE